MSNQQENHLENSGSPQNTKQANYPSTRDLVCPKCSGSNLNILGTKGAKGTAVGMGMALGAIGNLVADSISKDDFTFQPVNYKCASCGKKFEALPLKAKPDEILDQPCTVTFTRLSCFAGMAVSQNVWLNGMKAGSIGNGKTITFQTFVKHNTVFVTDQYGVAFKGHYTFEAQSGGTEEINFKKKFK